MDKEKVKNKIIYFAYLLGMSAILILIAYTFFLRDIEVDVTQHITLEYDGENGVATVEAYYDGKDINQRTQEFLESCTYEIEPNVNLSNGDTIHIVTNYDESIAQAYNFKPKNLEKDIKVEGLHDKYETLDSINKKYKDSIFKAEDQYIEGREEDIYSEIYGSSSTYESVESKVVYQAFLHGLEGQTRDRLVEIVELDYVVDVEETEETTEDQSAEDNQTTEEQTTEIQTTETTEEDTQTEEQSEEATDDKNTEETPTQEIRTIYYLVALSGINDGNEFDAQDIFGEKAYLSEEEINLQNFEGYMQRVYGDKYDIQAVEQKVEETDKEKEETKE